MAFRAEIDAADARLPHQAGPFERAQYRGVLLHLCALPHTAHRVRDSAMSIAWKLPAVILLVSVARVLCTAQSDQDLAELIQQIYVGQVARPDANATAALQIRTDSYLKTFYMFPCDDNIKCSGWLYTPEPVISRRSGSSKPPVIVMGHGLGGDKNQLDKYALKFVEAGFAVFSFDYRYWGRSEGEPMRWISPKKQVAGWLSAVAYVHTQLNSTVDVNRLSLWGTSFGGGHVITVASKLGNQVKAVISQVPHLNGRLANIVNMIQRGTFGTTLLSAAALTDVASFTYHKQNVYVPLARPHASLAVMQLGHEELSAYYKYKGFANNNSSEPKQDPWKQYMTRASLVLELTLTPYSPIEHIKEVKAPLLIVAAIKDTLCPYPAALVAQATAANATLVSFNCLHFDIYNSLIYDQAVSKEVEYLKSHAM